MEINSHNEPPAPIARVVAEHKSIYGIRAGKEEYSATLRGTFHESRDFPKVGDFVEYEEIGPQQAVILSICPRKTQIIRDATERSRISSVQKKQIIVTNVDIIFIVMGLDGDFNPERLLRYLALAKESGIMPVIILNKSDTVAAIATYLSQVVPVAGETPVHFVSARTGDGMSVFQNYFRGETTAVLLGSSGAGKSTITNWLLGHQAQLTSEVRISDSRGMHTTSSRELFELPHGGFLIDTPGMRELGTIAAANGEEDVFAQISSLARECKYSDCDHEKSQGCAIQEAFARGDIDEKLLRSYQKLEKEKRRLQLKKDPKSQLEQKQNVKRKRKEYKKISKERASGENYTTES